MASCENCFRSYEYNPDAPEQTLLPSREPGEKSEYHFMSFGWLVAGTLCGAYALKHNKDSATFEEVYADLLRPKLSDRTLKAEFRPLGGSGGHVLAQTVTSDIKASQIMQRRREEDISGEKDGDEAKIQTATALKSFQGKEFLVSANENILQPLCSTRVCNNCPCPLAHEQRHFSSILASGTATMP
jgi:hypothetical protein